MPVKLATPYEHSFTHDFIAQWDELDLSSIQPAGTSGFYGYLVDETDSGGGNSGVRKKGVTAEVLGNVAHGGTIPVHSGVDENGLCEVYTEYAIKLVVLGWYYNDEVEFLDAYEDYTLGTGGTYTTVDASSLAAYPILGVMGSVPAGLGAGFHVRPMGATYTALGGNDNYQLQNFVVGTNASGVFQATSQNTSTILYVSALIKKNFVPIFTPIVKTPSAGSYLDLTVSNPAAKFSVLEVIANAAESVGFRHKGDTGIDYYGLVFEFNAFTIDLGTDKIVEGKISATSVTVKETAYWIDSLNDKPVLLSAGSRQGGSAADIEIPLGTNFATFQLTNEDSDDGTLIADVTLGGVSVTQHSQSPVSRQGNPSGRRSVFSFWMPAANLPAAGLAALAYSFSGTAGGNQGQRISWMFYKNASQAEPAYVESTANSDFSSDVQLDFDAPAGSIAMVTACDGGGGFTYETDPDDFNLIYMASISGDVSALSAYKEYDTDTSESVTFPGVTGDSPNMYSGAAMIVVAAAELEQEGFRFYNDDGDEDGSTAVAAQDTNITRALDLATIIRLAINATRDPPSSQYQLEYKKSTDSVWSKVQALLGAGTMSYGAAGTGASGTTSCTPSYPSGISALTSELLCCVTGRSNTASTAPTMPAGWTAISGADLEGGTGTFGVDTGTRRVTWFKKDTVTGTETGTVTVSLAGTSANTLRATIHRVEKNSGYVLQVSATTGADTSNGTGYSATGSGNLTFLANDLLLIGVAQNLDTGTQSSQSITATGVTFGTRTNRASTAVTNGNDHRHIVDSVPISSVTGTPDVAPVYAYTVSAAASGPCSFVRLRCVPPDQPVLLSASSNITASGESTTARLTAPSGKTTSDFSAGRIQDDENPADAVDIGADKYTEMAWCIKTQAPATYGGVYQFRVTNNGTALDTYTVTPELTVDPGVTVVGTSALYMEDNDSTALPDSVPSDAVAVVILVHSVHTDDTTPGQGVDAITSDFTGTITIIDSCVSLEFTDNQTYSAVAVGTITSTGAGKHLTVDYTNPPYASAGAVTLAFLKGIPDPDNIASWVRDTGVHAKNNSDAVSVTIDSESSDVVLVNAGRFGDKEVPPAGWTTLDFIDGGAITALLRKADSPGASSTACAVESPSFSSVAALSIFRYPEEGDSGALTCTMSFAGSVTGALTGRGQLTSAVSTSLSVTGQLRGRGVLASNMQMTFTDAGTLRGKGALLSTMPLAFTESGSLKGAGALTSGVSLSITQAGLLTGLGQLTSTIPLSLAMTNNLSGLAPLTSTIQVAFASSGSLLGAGALSSSIPLSFDDSGILLGAGELTAGISFAFSMTGNGTARHPLSSAMSMSSTLDGVLTGAGALSASIPLAFGAVGALGGAGALISSVAVVTTASGTLTGSGALSSTIQLTYSVTGNFNAQGSMSSIIVCEFSQSGVLIGAGELNSSVSLAFVQAGVLTGEGAVSSVLSATFSSSGILDNVASGALATNISFTLNQLGTLTGAGALSSTIALSTVVTPLLRGRGELNTSISLLLDQSGAMTSHSALSSSMGLSFAVATELTGVGELQSAIALAFGMNGAFTADAQLTTSIQLSFDMLGTFVLRNDGVDIALLATYTYRRTLHGQHTSSIQLDAGSRSSIDLQASQE